MAFEEAQLLVGTPFIVMAKLLLHQAARNAERIVMMVLDVNCAVLSWGTRRKVYIVLQDQLTMANRGLDEHIWPRDVRKSMDRLECTVIVALYAGDFL